MESPKEVVERLRLALKTAKSVRDKVDDYERGWLDSIEHALMRLIRTYETRNGL